MAEESPPHAPQNKLPRLFQRYLESDLSLKDLAALADGMFAAAPEDARFIEGAFREPPEPGGVMAPMELFAVLDEILHALPPTPAGSPEATALWNATQVRLAICTCLIESVPRRNRISSAFNRLFKLQIDAEAPWSSVCLRWLAEIGVRLIFEFDADREPDQSRLLEFVRLTVLSLASKGLPRADFHRLLRTWCELTLRMPLPTPDASEAVQNWHAEVSDAIARFSIQSDDVRPKTTTSAVGVADLVKQFVAAAMLRDAASLRLATRTVETATCLDHLGADAEDLHEVLVTLVAIARRQGAHAPILDAAMRESLVTLRTRCIQEMVRSQQIRSQSFQTHLDEVTELGAILDQTLAGELSPEARARRNILEARMQARNALPEINPTLAAAAVDELLAAKPRRRGLALSGGGFRAACFHLGVLASLADRDLLRRLDVLSCVSGGSIVGAAYAVRLKALLASKHDLAITSEDYRDIVRDLVAVFAQLTRMNLRARALANPLAMLRMWLWPDYTFTERIADLLDAHLFVPLIAQHPAVAAAGRREFFRRARMRKGQTLPGMWGSVLHERVGWPLAPWDLRAAPYGEGSGFDPASSWNRLRRAKCPELFLHTTSLNTGGSFLFSTDGNGELPDHVHPRISSRPKQAWRAYHSITAGGMLNPRQYRLARLVAASASVPGLLPPVLFRRVNQEALVALVDGGLRDNQGMQPLLESGCDWILASDASGQLRAEDFPDVTGYRVMGRATDILMERIREMSYRSATSPAQNDMAFKALHLTRDMIDPPPQATFEIDDSLANMRYDKARTARCTRFGVVVANQEALSRIRTDLDCFSEIEAFALMADGYLQAQHSADADTYKRSAASPAPSATRSSAATPCSFPPWQFERMSAELGHFDERGLTTAVLQTAASRFGRLPALLGRRLSRALPARITALRSSMIGLAVLALSLLLLQAPLVAIAEQGIANHQTLVRGVLLYMSAVACVNLLPPSAIQRWLWQLLSGPLLLVAMIHAWLAILFSDPIYRRMAHTARLGNASRDSSGEDVSPGSKPTSGSESTSRDARPETRKDTGA